MFRESVGRFLRSGLGVLLALAATEVAARRLDCRRYVYDEARGYVLAPGQVRVSDEAFATSTWQVAGVRRPAPWSDGAPKIIALGDSFTEALMIDDADVYTVRLEHELAERGWSIQVLNLGRAEYSVADHIALAPFYIARFSPTWTIVEVRSSDFAEDAWPPGAAQKTHFVSGAGGLTIHRVVTRERTGAARALWNARQQSMALAWTASRFTEIMGAARAEPPLFRGAKTAPAAPAPPRDYPVEEELDLLVQAYSGRLTLFYDAVFDPAHPSLPGPLEERILDHCAAHHISCVGIRARFPELAAQGLAPTGFATSSYNHGHSNALGHRLYSEALAGELSSLHARGMETPAGH